MTVVTNPRKTGLPDSTISMGVFLPGKPTNAQLLVRLVATQAYKLASGLGTSRASAGTAATAASSFKLQKNGADIGTVDWAIAATIATFTLATTTAFAVGDVLSIVAPASADATLADISFTLSGLRD